MILGGPFTVQEILLQILDLYIGLFLDVCREIAIKFFEKRGGGGSKALWNFSENSSVLVWPPVPYCGDDDDDDDCYD